MKSAESLIDPLSFEPIGGDPHDQPHANDEKDELPNSLVAGLANDAIRRIASGPNILGHAHTVPPAVNLEDLCAALIQDDDVGAIEVIFSALEEETTEEVIYLKYLASAARMLGDWWLEDRASFAQVTIGTGTIISVMRKLKRRYMQSHSSRDVAVVFASVPGEDHTLGVRMAADLFRADGWDIELKTGQSYEELVADIERLPKSIVGLSIGGKRSLESLSRLVVALQECCPNAALVVCGHGVKDIKPQLSLMRLDGVAVDFEQARYQMAMLWDREMARSLGSVSQCPKH